MINSPGATVMRNFFINDKRVQTTTDLAYSTFHAAKDTLPYPSQWSSTALEVGGFANANVINNGNGTATFYIPNTAGAQSFFYHALPDIPKSWGNVPMHNVKQIFTWTEPIPTGLSTQ